MIHDRTKTLPRAGRGQFVSGVLLGLCLGVLSGHLLFVGLRSSDEAVDEAAMLADLWGPADSPLPEAEDAQPLSDVEFSMLEVNPHAGPGRASVSDEPADDGLHFFPESVKPRPAEQVLSEPTQLAWMTDSDSGGSLRMTADTGDRGDAAPQALEPVPSATPIDRQTSQREALARRLIREELPEASPQEQDVWCEVLLGLPAEDIQGILRMRKRLGSGSSGALAGESALSWPKAAVRSDGPPPDDSVRVPHDSAATARHRDTINTLRALYEIDWQNLLNRETIAYRQIVPNVAESGVADTAERPDMPEFGGIRLLGLTRDMAAGELRRTGRPLDVGIDPDATRIAFLQVRSGDDVCYTRSGRLDVDGEGRLKLQTAEADWRLDPPIRIPGDTRELIIIADGRVRVTTSNGEEASDVGRINAFLFFNPAGLRPTGGGLYQATAASGPPNTTAFGTAESGDLIQGHVESANIDERVIRNRMAWQQSMIEMLTERSERPTLE